MWSGTIHKIAEWYIVKYAKKKTFTHTEYGIQLHQRPLVLLQRSQEFVQLGLNQKSLS